MKKRRTYFIIGVLALIVVAAVIFRIATRRSASGPRRANVPLVRAEAPTRDTVSYTLKSTGDVVSMQQASIVAKVGGSLGEVAVNMGARVNRDQLLAVIDAPELTQQLQQTAATYLTTQAEYQRKKELLEQKMTSPQDFENADAAMKVAEASYQMAQTRLSYASVTAPFAGTITRRYFDPGAIVTANSSVLFTLMDLDNLKVVINVLEKDVPLIALGAGAVVRADALPDESLEGQVGRLSQAVDPATRTMPVEVFVTSRDYRHAKGKSEIQNPLKPGMYATVTLVLSEHPNAITIPTQAVLTDANGTFVYVVRNDTARRQLVQAGIAQGARTEIVTGLSGTEKVITTGQQYVKNGGAVSVQQ